MWAGAGGGMRLLTLFIAPPGNNIFVCSVEGIPEQTPGFKIVQNLRNPTDPVHFPSFETVPWFPDKKCFCTLPNPQPRSVEKQAT